MFKNKSLSFKTKLDWKTCLRKVAIALLTILSICVLICYCLFDGRELMDFKTIGEEISEGSSSYTRKFIGTPIAIFLSALALSFSGYSMQVVSRNPLASPTTLGYLPAAILGLAISKLAINHVLYLPFIIGIVFASCLIVINFFLVKENALEASFKPILVGFAIGGIITGINVLLEDFAKDIHIKITGFVEPPINFQWQHLYVGGPLIIISGLANLFMAPYYTIISKDYLLAKSLGIKVDLVFWLTAFFAIVSTVSSIILVGVLTLLGMIAPHVARILNPKGNSFQQLLLSFMISLLLLTSSRWLISVYNQFDINFFSAIAALPVFAYIFVSKQYRKNVE